MNVEFTKSFEKDLLKIFDSKLSEKVQALIEQIEKAQDLSEITHLKKLKGEDNCYRIRLGDYRVGITVEDDVICLIRILHRKEIYRYFP